MNTFAIDDSLSEDYPKSHMVIEAMEWLRNSQQTLRSIEGRVHTFKILISLLALRVPISSWGTGTLSQFVLERELIRPNTVPSHYEEPKSKLAMPPLSSDPWGLRVVPLALFNRPLYIRHDEYRVEKRLFIHPDETIIAVELHASFAGVHVNRVHRIDVGTVDDEYLEEIIGGDEQNFYRAINALSHIMNHLMQNTQKRTAQIREAHEDLKMVLMFYLGITP